MLEYLSELNSEQKKAVLCKDGPILIIAGAGAGKTKTLTSRIIHLIKEGVEPQNILAITFTNKASKEMRERTYKLISENTHTESQPFVSTFHSLGVHILKNNSKLLNIPRHFSICDKQDAESILKEVIKDLDLNPKQFEPKRISGIISRNKGDLIDAELYKTRAGNQYFPKILSDIWSGYEKKLLENKSLDLDDLILKTAQLLERNEEVLKYYQNLWKYIHVDEYQDTNTAQYRLTQLLANKHKNICVVGDMDQSIYSWRGADFKNILKFEEDYPETKTILLEQNYRSSANILAVANNVIKKNKIRKDKNLFTKKEGGEKISLFEAFDENEEAYFVAYHAQHLIKKGLKPEDIAVLYRNNYQSRILEEAFLTLDIPYQVLGVKFFNRREIKDLLSFIRASLNPASLADIKRTINLPPRGIGKVTIAKMFSGKENELSSAMQEKINNFKNLLEEIKNKAKEIKTSELIKFIIKKTGLEEHFKKGGEGDYERLENMRELVTLAKKYDHLEPEEAVEDLLTSASLASDQDSLYVKKEKEHNAVRLMTVHASKGLEFPCVFITGLEQGLFPHNLINNDPNRDAEEERRLFYVALTRAEKKLFLSYAGMRTIFGSKQINMPSEFLSDIEDEFIELEKGKPEDTIMVD